jgi:nicotianamine synthase
MTPTITIVAKEAGRIAEEILSLVDTLASSPDLKPSPDVNELFNRLVSLCIKPYSSSVAHHVLDNKKIQSITPQLRQMCSEGEGELERHWAHLILDSCQDLVSSKLGVTKGLSPLLDLAIS